MSNPKKKSRIRPLYAFAYPWLSPLVKLFCNVRVKGKENIPKEGGCVVCANHISNSDILIIGAAFPMRRQVNTLAKAELFSLPFFRSIIRGMGGIPVNRKTTNVESVRKCIALAKDGRVVMVFPQGKRCFGVNPADTLTHPGAAMIAMRSQCPIVPVTIKTKGMRFRFFKRTEVIISPPVSYEEMRSIGENSTDYKAITAHIFNIICKAGGFSKTEAGDDHDSNRS